MGPGVGGSFGCFGRYGLAFLLVLIIASGEGWCRWWGVRWCCCILLVEVWFRVRRLWVAPTVGGVTGGWQR